MMYLRGKGNVVLQNKRKGQDNTTKKEGSVPLRFRPKLHKTQAKYFCVNMSRPINLL